MAAPPLWLLLAPLGSRLELLLVCKFALQPAGGPASKDHNGQEGINFRGRPGKHSSWGHAACQC